MPCFTFLASQKHLLLSAQKQLIEVPLNVMISASPSAAKQLSKLSDKKLLCLGLSWPCTTAKSIAQSFTEPRRITNQYRITNHQYLSWHSHVGSTLLDILALEDMVTHMHYIPIIESPLLFGAFSTVGSLSCLR